MYDTCDGEYIWIHVKYGVVQSISEERAIFG